MKFEVETELLNGITKKLIVEFLNNDGSSADGLTALDFLREIVSLMQAMGYHLESIEEAILVLADEYYLMQKEKNKEKEENQGF